MFLCRAPSAEVFALIVFSALMFTVERGDWYPESLVLRQPV